MVKKVLLINDSALMRSIISDIINSEKGLEVTDASGSGLEAIRLLQSNEYDCIVLDSHMLRTRGAEFLKRIFAMDLSSAVVMLSDVKDECNAETLRALEAGAVDFIKIPSSFYEMKRAKFREMLLCILKNAIEACEKSSKAMHSRDTADAALPDTRAGEAVSNKIGVPFMKRNIKGKLVAIACSTGGPKALQEVVPYIPDNIDAPVLIVQHMPKEFTNSLAERLDSLSTVKVCEASENDILEKGVVYIAKGGYHMAVKEQGKNRHCIRILDDPPRTGLKPCADVMYESLAVSGYEQITCVVMTGMGNDGTQGIRQLKTKKNVYVIAQDEATSTVYGMPRAVYEAGLTDEVVPLKKLSEAIIRITGVR